MRTELFSSPFWKVKVPNHNKIKEKYLDLFIKGYEDNIYKIPEGWTTHKCHTSFEQKLLFDEDIHDEYESIFKSIFGGFSGHLSCWYQVYKNNEYQEWHDHMPSTLSAIHFLNFDKEHKAPMFEDPIRALRSIMNSTCMGQCTIKPTTYTPDVEEGDIIVFPSYLLHTIPAKQYETHRVTIALNLNEY